MYVDSKNNRVLLRNGTSIITAHEFARKTISGKDTSMHLVSESYDTDAYKLVYGADISGKIEDIQINPQNEKDQDFNQLLTMIENSDRLRNTDEEFDRIEIELDFFIRTNNINFLYGIIELINKFRKDGTVWGVGRGSACASYILYLLGVHDVDCIRYKIPFSELSKEIIDV